MEVVSKDVGLKLLRRVGLFELLFFGAKRCVWFCPINMFSCWLLCVLILQLFCPNCV